MRWLLILLLPAAALAGPMDKVVFKANHQLAEALDISAPDGTYRILSNTLTFSSADMETFAGGTVYLRGMEIQAIPGTRRLSMAGGFTLENPHIGTAGGRLYILNMDVRKNGLCVSSADMNLAYDASHHPLGSLYCATNFGPTVDVTLTRLDSLQQQVRVPGVSVSMSALTQLKNIGDYDAPWYWAISPSGGTMPVVGQHPYVIFNLYWIANGMLEQIARSEAKHAFFSTNEGCPCAGGQTLHVGCSDTYGAANNANQFYFAPRQEITAHTAGWNSLGSHFDVSAAEPVPDDVRSHNGESDGLTHLLVAPESALQETGNQVFVEAWYLVQNDTNIFNSMGHRQVTPTWNGSVWSFAFNTTLTTGPVINSWGAQTHATLDTGEGHLQLAAETTPLTNGLVQYRYALMNFDFDRQVGEFSVPLLPDILATNFTFLDGDANSSNDWTSAMTNGAVRWQSPTTNGLDWGVLFSFSFDANVPSENGAASLGVLETASNETLTIATRVPHAPLAVLGAGPEISWSAASGSIYQVQSADLLTSVWLNVQSPVTAQLDNLSLLDTNESATQKFYRVLLNSTTNN